MHEIDSSVCECVWIIVSTLRADTSKRNPWYLGMFRDRGSFKIASSRGKHETWKTKKIHISNILSALRCFDSGDFENCMMVFCSATKNDFFRPQNIYSFSRSWKKRKVSQKRLLSYFWLLCFHFLASFLLHQCLSHFFFQVFLILWDGP